MTVEKSHFLNLSNVSVCIKTTSCFGISLSEQDFIADSRVPGRLAAQAGWVRDIEEETKIADFCIAIFGQKF